MSAANWKIADSLFYPLGLFNNSSKSKIVFVTWTFDCLYTYIFKKTGENSALKDTCKIIINKTIQDITVTEYNTLVLMRNGQVYYFSSCRNLRRLKFLSGVKCIASRQAGFAVIRVNENNAILLEIFQDFSDSHKLESEKKTFDISFDELNIFNSAWKDEKLSLLTVRIGAENKKFFDLIAKRTVDSDEIYLFSISNNLFCLLPSRSEENEDNYEISLITTEPSQIETVRLMQSINALLIFMNCGAIEIIFYSHLLHMLDRIMHVTGPDIIASTFENDCFYYSDGENVVKTEFTYDDNEYTCNVQEYTKPIPNIVALTWVKSIQKLVCLSENNIFYRTKFTKSETTKAPTNDEFFELNDKKLKENEQNLNQVVDLIKETNNIYTDIENEVYKQELIAVAKRKDIYINLVSAVVSFYSCIPEIKPDTFILNEGTLSQRDHYFVLISFSVIWNEIFRNGLWSLVINLSSSLSSFWTLKIDQNIIKNSFNVLVPVRKEKSMIPPSILIELASFVKVDKDFVYLALPVNFKNYHFYNLFTFVPVSMEHSRKKINKLDKILCDLAERNDPLNECELSKKKFCVKIRTPLIMSIDDLCEMFNIHRKQIDDGIEDINLYFLGEKVVIKYVETQNYVQVTTEDPIALFYAKLVITKGLSSEYYNDDTVDVKAAERPLTEIQCQVEGRYGSGYSVEAYAASLSRLYTQLRHDTIKQF